MRASATTSLFAAFAVTASTLFAPTAAASTSERIEEVISGGLSQSEDPSRYDWLSDDRLIFI